MRREDELILQEEFRRQGGWSFNPIQFGFRIAKRWSKGILDHDWDRADYWYEADRTIQEAHNVEHRKINPLAGEIFYTCSINKTGAKDYRFTIIENNYNRGSWDNDPGPVVFNYNVPNVEVAKIILADLIPAGQWYKED